MFLPEELITYAVYSNPADFCQGTRTPERWLRRVLSGRGGWFDRHTGDVVGGGRLAWTGPGPQVVVGCVLNVVSQGVMWQGRKT